DDDSVRGSSKINIADMLLELLEDASSDSGFDAVVGGYVESSLLDFVACSRWQFGYVSSNGVIVDSDDADKVPLLWYGPDNMLPNEKWSIKYGEQISECWFTDDDWELLNYFVEDCTESFSIWYRLECRMCLPDMKKILSECPVSFLETDCLEDINRKIMLFSEMRLNV
ncbi:MAG: hypothetical protein IIW62_04175, partial [Selenomonadales bacterium]|nr:hypothetical protein [Selenomonadales bacterium]